jgi:hypothetical protein
VADPLTRVNLGDAFQFNREVFNALEVAVNGFDIDRFATARNTLLPTFNSYFLEPGCAGVDAFAQADWESTVSYCHPPIGVLPKLANFLLDVHPTARAVVIAPKW